MIFISKTEIKNFKSVFPPPKSFALTRSALKSLKVKAVGIICNILKWMTKVESATKLSTDLQLNCNNIKCLPLGFHTNKPPNPSTCCDMLACPHQSDAWNGKYSMDAFTHST